MKNISIWKDYVKRKEYEKLNKNLDVDVLIIGGGITGLSTLYHLEKRGLNVVLVEQNRLGDGITGNSTGKLTYLQNDLIDKIRCNFSDEVANHYLQSQKYAINRIVSTITKEKIDCDLELCSSYVYTNKDSEVSKIKDLKLFLKKCGIDCIDAKSDLVQSKYMIKVDDTYLINPIKLICGLAGKIKAPIYENTRICKIENIDSVFVCHTDSNIIRAKKVVIASHYPYFNKPFFFPIKGYLEKSYISASKSSTKPISLISYKNPFISIRNYKDNLIYLSNTHSINTDVCDKNNYQELCKKVNNIGLQPSYLWCNIDIISNDGLPYIGRLYDNLYISTGYNTWGLTNGYLGGIMISDLIMNKENEYSNLFNPHRVNVKQIVGPIMNGVKSIKGYIKGYTTKNSNVSYEKIDGKNVMIYDNNIVHRKCPHMGCKLLFNEMDKTWDCPCHGSRFNIDGKVINGPSKDDITFK